MTIADAYEACRYTSAVLAVGVLCVMAVRWRAFTRASQPSQAGRIVVMWLVAANAFGTIGALWRDIPAGPWTPTISVGMLLAARWMWIDWREQRRQIRCVAELVPTPRASAGVR